MRPSTSQQRFAQLCARVAEDMRAREGELPTEYLRRVREAALKVEHRERRAKRAAARAARKRNR